MQRGLGVGIGRQGAVSEAVRLFVLPPLLTLALVALSLVLFTSHLSRKDLQTTFVRSSEQQADYAPRLNRAAASLAW